MKKDCCKKWVSLFFLFFALFLLDACFKYYAYANIPQMSGPFPYGGIRVFENIFHVSFSLNYVENQGAAWGMFSSFSSYLFFLRVLLVIGLIVFIFFNKDSRKTTPLLLIFTGALGNVTDKFFYGQVIDMFHFTFAGRSYGIFNFADAMIAIGVFWLFIISTKSKNKKKPSTTPA